MVEPVSISLGAAALGSVAAGAEGASALAGIGMGATALGGLTSAIGSIMGGISGSNMYNYQAGIAKINSQIAKQNADYARAVGEQQAETSGMKTRAQIGSTKAIQGAHGFDVNSGSAALVRGSEAEIGQFDQSVIRSNAAKRAYGYEVEALQDTAQGKIYGMAAQGSMTQGILGATGSILGTAGSVAGKWLDASRLGIGSSSVLGTSKPGDLGLGDY